MSELVAFLRARLDEDEEIARDASVTMWTKVESPSVFVMGAHGLVAQTEAFTDARHIARWDPARVLAEVDAKRRILDEFGPALAQEERDPADMENQAVLGTLERVAALLALPYADHPDYRPEWAPGAAPRPTTR